MTTPDLVVPLRVLGTDVDVHVSGHDREALAHGIRTRWHLCLRDERLPGDRPDHEPRVVRATLLAPEGEPEPASAWTRGDNDVRDRDPRRLLQRLTQSVTHEVISARTGELLMLHAAGLADPDTGATAVFVAPGNTGKTTLSRTLGPNRRYLSDETVGIRRDGTVVPYPKPLSVRRSDWRGVKDETAPGDVGLQAPEVEPWLAGIVLIRRDEDHVGPPSVERLDVLDAVIALTPESSGFMRTDAPLHWVAEVLDRTGGAVRVTYAEVADLEPLVAKICSRNSPWGSGPIGLPSAGSEGMRPAGSEGMQPAGSSGCASPAATVLRTVPAHDELHKDGESLVLLDGQVRRMSPIGTVIRASAQQGATVERLAEVLEEIFGVPEDGDALSLTRTAVRTMLAEGLLEELPAAEPAARPDASDAH